MNIGNLLDALAQAGCNPADLLVDVMDGEVLIATGQRIVSQAGDLERLPGLEDSDA